MELVQPEVIVSVGSTVKGHLSRYFTKMINVPVVYMKHPAGLNRMSHSEKVLELQPTINAIKEVCKSSSGAVTRRG
jgi:uracil-DNA glycosylase